MSMAIPQASTIDPPNYDDYDPKQESANDLTEHQDDVVIA